MFRVHRDFKGLLKAAQDEYDSLVELNESLRKKVAEWNKDEESLLRFLPLVWTRPQFFRVEHDGA